MAAPKGVLDKAENSGDEFVPWARLPGDGTASWRAFTIYRDMGLERSMPAVAKQLKCSVGNIRWMSARYEWPARVAAYDAWCDAEYRKFVAKQRREVATAHALAAKLMRERAVEAIKEMPLETLLTNPSACVAMIREATRLETELFNVRPLGTDTPADTADSTGVYLDSRPLPELIAMTRQALTSLENQAARQKAVAQDAQDAHKEG